MPTDGWPYPPNAARLALGKVDGGRLLALSTRALFLARLPAPIHREEWFQWLLTPDSRLDLDECVWYTDGSVLDPTAGIYAASGFATVVTTKLGTLVGVGFGAPPYWVDTAAAAEAWAIRHVLNSTALVPMIYTDCLSLVRTVEAGVSSATGADRRLARIWHDIAHVTDGDFQQLSNQLRWLPAHKSLDQALQLKASDGSRVTALDWRANRLVDAVAKRAASLSKTDSSILRFLDSARTLLAHKAAVLAQATFKANHCPTEVDDGHGGTKTVFKRDATPRPKDLPAATRPHKVPTASTWARKLPTVKCTSAPPDVSLVPQAANSASGQMGISQLMHGTIVSGPGDAGDFHLSWDSGGADGMTAQHGTTHLVGTQAHLVGNHACLDGTAFHLDGTHDTVVAQGNQAQGILDSAQGKLASISTPCPDVFLVGNQVGVNRLDETMDTPASSSSVTHSLYANVVVDTLVDTKGEDEAIAKLPAAQRINFSTDSGPSAQRTRASGDKQCIARRGATAARARNAEATVKLVQNIGDRAAANAPTARASATNRMEALRERIRARQLNPD